MRRLQPSLHRLRAAGEYHLERQWAARIRDSPDPHRELRRFPCYDHYRQLTRLEHHALEGLGLGPHVDNLDLDRGAVEPSARLASTLGIGDLGFVHADLLDHTALDSYDLVVLAALVGLDRPAKLRALHHLRAHMAPGALLLVRSSHALKVLLYPVHVDDLVGLRPAARRAAAHDVINSIIVAQRAA